MKQILVVIAVLLIFIPAQLDAETIKVPGD
jgi:hypothetical protein